MENIFQKIQKPQNSTHLYAKASGKNRGEKAIKSVFEKAYYGHYNLSETKIVCFQIASGKQEITIDEIAGITNTIQDNFKSDVSIVMSVLEKDLEDEVEVHIVFTKLDFDTKNFEVEKVFNPTAPNVKSLPIYFLEEEYSSEELSEAISVLSDLYKEIGGDGLRIKGFSKVQVNKFVEPLIF